MVLGLERRQADGDLHFVTFSCWHRLGYLAAVAARDVFEQSLEMARMRCRFAVVGYVVMPEHVHLLVREPARGELAGSLRTLKQSVARRSEQSPFWLPRYYDFNVTTDRKRVEKLSYIHWNPVKRGLVDKPEDWRWSSCHFYQTGKRGRVTIDDSWLGS